MLKADFHRGASLKDRVELQILEVDRALLFGLAPCWVACAESAHVPQKAPWRGIENFQQVAKQIRK